MIKQKQGFIFLIVDLFLIGFSLFLSISIRFLEQFQFLYRFNEFFPYLVGFILLKILFLLIFNCYKILWQYGGVSDYFQIIYATILPSVTLFIVSVVLNLVWELPYLLPRSVILTDFLFSTFLIVSARVYYRMIFQGRFGKKIIGKQINTIIFGAGSAGEMIARSILSNAEDSFKYNLIGFIDDNLNKKGMILQGKTVFGGRDEIVSLVKKFNIEEIIVAVPTIKNSVLRDIVKGIENYKIRVQIVPKAMRYADNITLENIRNIRIEDLLGREEVQLNIDEVSNYLLNSNILITGAGGSIGSEICRQVARFNPKNLFLLGKGENSIFYIEKELFLKYPQINYHPMIVDIRDSSKIDRIIKENKIDVIFHCAAHKHVFLMEQQPDESFKNNVLGSLNLIQAADKYNVGRFVLISTDKAVRPTSVMGMTKRIVELIMLSYALKSKTTFCAVRFGNVLGSRGSVIPIFADQIKKGGPVTVTHPEVTRYFMTIPEASKLVIQSAALSKGGEIFVLDMGEPIKIIDLAKEMIILSGLTPDVDIEIEFTGLKEGEKLYEEIISINEEKHTTKYEKIFVTNPPEVNKEELMKKIEQINQKIANNQVSNLKEDILQLVEFYN